MNTYKSLALAGLATASLFASQAFATPCPAGTMGTPVCVATTSPEVALVDLLGPSTNPNSIFSHGPGVNPYTQQAQAPFWQVDSSGGSASSIVLQLASYANHFTFGIFDPNNPNTKLAIFTNGLTGNSATLYDFNNGGYSVGNGINPSVTFTTTNLFGFYLTTPQGNTFYSAPPLNSDAGLAHMLAYYGDGSNTIAPYGDKPGGVFGPDEYLLAWEDLLGSQSDLDYNDFMVIVDNIAPGQIGTVRNLPEPTALGIFGLGALLIGLFAGLRRRGESA